MTHYTKDLIDPCRCAMKNDALWFLDHMDRRKYVRRAWVCEETKDLDPGVVQVVVVWLDKSMAEMMLDTMQALPVTVVAHRRSFLFTSASLCVDVDSDDKVDQFLTLIDDGYVAPGTRPN